MRPIKLPNIIYQHTSFKVNSLCVISKPLRVFIVIESLCTRCFIKKLYPLLFCYIFTFTKTNFMKIPYTRGIGHCEHKINMRDSLTVLCHCHYNEGTAKCQENKHKTRFILMQTSVYVNSENHHLLPKLFNISILQ